MLRIYKDQRIVEQRHRHLKQTLRVRPVFFHNDDRIESLVAVIGITLLIFRLIEAELAAELGDRVALPSILPESRTEDDRPCGPCRLRRPVGHLRPGALWFSTGSPKSSGSSLPCSTPPWPERSEE